MIGPIGAARIQRSAATARIVRKPGARTDVTAFESDMAEPTVRRRAPRQERDEGEYPDRSGRKVSPAVLAALLKLKRGG